MIREKQLRQAEKAKRKRLKAIKTNRQGFSSLLSFVFPEKSLSSNCTFHGNIGWSPEHLVSQALIWSWQDSKNVTDSFEKTLEICEQLRITKIPKTYTAFMNAISRYRMVLGEQLRKRHQALAEQIGEKQFRNRGWLLMAIDGSRASTPRTVANEGAFCAPNYGKGMEAKYGKKKSKGLRRKRNKANPPAPPEPQIWITMMWHMGLRLPWTWRLGPSNSSERADAQEILEQEEFPEKTLFCGDAGFVGYPLWESIISSGADFLVRVGANVHLLSEQADIQTLADRTVYCWPKGKRGSCRPLKLRLVRVKVGKTRMWMLTSVLDKKNLPVERIITYYKMRWGIEVEFRGLKQTIDKQKLRCKNSARVLAELDWSLRGMAMAELLALKAQLPATQNQKEYEIKDRSLAKTIRALRRCMRNLNADIGSSMALMKCLASAQVQRYHNTTDKRARYRPKNPDIKPLGDPKIEKITISLRNELSKIAA